MPHGGMWRRNLAVSRASLRYHRSRSIIMEKQPVDHFIDGKGGGVLLL